jgi:hypothetical protein
MPCGLHHGMAQRRVELRGDLARASLSFFEIAAAGA